MEGNAKQLFVPGPHRQLLMNPEKLVSFFFGGGGGVGWGSGIKTEAESFPKRAGAKLFPQ